MSDPSLGVGSVPCRTDGTTIMTVIMTKPQRDRTAPVGNSAGVGRQLQACLSLHSSYKSTVEKLH